MVMLALHICSMVIRLRTSFKDLLFAHSSTFLIIDHLAFFGLPTTMLTKKVKFEFLFLFVVFIPVNMPSKYSTTHPYTTI
jgi:hypothetical protein